MSAHQDETDAPSRPATGRRDRKKMATRIAIEDAAVGLYATRGFKETSVLDITEAADVSQRTFYRYFTSKEDVLFGSWRQDLAVTVKVIESRPQDESPLEAMRGALLAMAEHFEQNRERYSFIAQLSASSPDVAAYQGQVIIPAVVEAFAEGLARRLGVEALADLRPYVFAGVAAAAVNAAMVVWVAESGTELLENVLLDALDLLSAP